MPADLAWLEHYKRYLIDYIGKLSESPDLVPLQM